MTKLLLVSKVPSLQIDTVIIFATMYYTITRTKMSPSENASSTPMDRLRILAQISGNKEIGSDLDELEAVEEEQDGIRERIERMQRDLQILGSVA